MDCPVKVELPETTGFFLHSLKAPITPQCFINITQVITSGLCYGEERLALCLQKKKKKT